MQVVLQRLVQLVPACLCCSRLQHRCTFARCRSSRHHRVDFPGKSTGTFSPNFEGFEYSKPCEIPCHAAVAVVVGVVLALFPPGSVHVIIHLCCVAGPAAAAIAVNAVAATSVGVSGGVVVVGSAAVAEAAAAAVRIEGDVVVSRKCSCAHLLIRAVMHVSSASCPFTRCFRQEAEPRWPPCCICWGSWKSLLTRQEFFWVLFLLGKVPWCFFDSCHNCWRWCYRYWYKRQQVSVQVDVLQTSTAEAKAYVFWGQAAIPRRRHSHTRGDNVSPIRSVFS